MPLLSAQAGKKLVETLTGSDGELLYHASYDVAPDNQLTLSSETWHQDELRQLNRQVQTGTLALGAENNALAAAKLVWDIIKDNKAVGKSADAKSSVLSAAATDPLDYENARDGASGTYTWEVNDALTIFGKINYVTIKVRAEGKYAATPVAGSKAPAGHYLPDVYVNVTQCTVNFPCSASGSANLSNPANIGRGEVDTEIRVHAKLTASWLLQHFGITVGFRATGSGGFRLLGRE